MQQAGGGGALASCGRQVWLVVRLGLVLQGPRYIVEGEGDKDSRSIGNFGRVEKVRRT